MKSKNTLFIYQNLLLYEKIILKQLFDSQEKENNSKKAIFYIVQKYTKMKKSTFWVNLRKKSTNLYLPLRAKNIFLQF